MDIPEIELKNLFQIIEYAILHKEISLRDDLKQKHADPNAVIDSRWSNYLESLSRKVSRELRSLPPNIEKKFRECNAVGVSKTIMKDIYTTQYIYTHTTITWLDKNNMKLKKNRQTIIDASNCSKKLKASLLEKSCESDSS